MSSITQNNDNSSESLLKEDSIENIFKYDYTEKKTYTTDITLQIIHMKKTKRVTLITLMRYIPPLYVIRNLAITDLLFVEILHCHL